MFIKSYQNFVRRSAFLQKAKHSIQVAIETAVNSNRAISRVPRINYCCETYKLYLPTEEKDAFPVVNAHWAERHVYSIPWVSAVCFNVITVKAFELWADCRICSSIGDDWRIVDFKFRWKKKWNCCTRNRIEYFRYESNIWINISWLVAIIRSDVTLQWAAGNSVILAEPFQRENFRRTNTVHPFFISANAYNITTFVSNLYDKIFASQLCCRSANAKKNTCGRKKNGNHIKNSWGKRQKKYEPGDIDMLYVICWRLFSPHLIILAAKYLLFCAKEKIVKHSLLVFKSNYFVWKQRYSKTFIPIRPEGLEFERLLFNFVCYGTMRNLYLTWYMYIIRRFFGKSSSAPWELFSGSDYWPQYTQCKDLLFFGIEIILVTAESNQRTEKGQKKQTHSTFVIFHRMMW